MGAAGLGKPIYDQFLVLFVNVPSHVVFVSFSRRNLGAAVRNYSFFSAPFRLFASARARS
jgi:hypothetical protein